MIAAGSGIATLAARRSLAGQDCTVSAGASLNPSGGAAICSGRSGGFWASNTSAWPGGIQPTMLWSVALAGAPAARVQTDGTLLDALNQKLTAVGSGSTASSELPAQIVAAILNAQMFGAAAFGYDVPGIIAFINNNWTYSSVLPGQPTDLTQALAMLNNRI